MITSSYSRKVGISFEVPLSDNLVDLLVIFLVVFVVCFILSKFYSCNLIKFLWSNSKYLPLLNKQVKLFGICLEQLACDNLFITVYRYHNGHPQRGGKACGAGLTGSHPPDKMGIHKRTACGASLISSHPPVWNGHPQKWNVGKHDGQSSAWQNGHPQKNSMWGELNEQSSTCTKRASMKRCGEAWWTVIRLYETGVHKKGSMWWG